MSLTVEEVAKFHASKVREITLAAEEHSKPCMADALPHARMAAKLNDSGGWVYLAEHCDRLGDKRLTYRYYLRAAEMGDACSKYNLGVMHQNGEVKGSKKRNNVEAMHFYRMAADDFAKKAEQKRQKQTI